MRSERWDWCDSCAEESGSSSGDAFVFTRRAWVRTAAHKVSNHGMASVGGEVARDDRDNLGIVAPRRINSRPVQSMHGRSAMQELSQLLKHGLSLIGGF